MSTQKTPQTPVALPGDPYIKDPKTGQRQTVTPGRVLREHNGQPMLCKNAVEGQAVASAATKYLGREICLVHFVSKTGARIESVGFAVSGESGGTLPHGGLSAIKAMLFFAQEQRGKAKAKLKALTVAMKTRTQDAKRAGEEKKNRIVMRRDLTTLTE